MKLRSASTRGHERADDLIKCEVRSRADDERIGRVGDILVDESDRIRYLVVSRDDRDDILLPVGNTRIAPESDVVWIYGLSSSGMHDLPTYDRTPEEIDRDYERRLNRAYDESYHDDHYYDRPDYASDGWNRGRGSEARSRNLKRLDDLDDYQVADHDHDPRGWDVVGRDGKKLGEVDHLIGDTGAMKVRYLVVDLDDDLLEEDREILVPAGHARLDPEEERVHVAALDRSSAGRLPAYEGGDVDRDFERQVCRIFGESYTDDSFYEHPRYRDDGLSAHREHVRAGGA